MNSNVVPPAASSQKSEEAVLGAMAGLIGTFLLARGGLRNGYNTYAKGSFSCLGSNIDVMVPNEDSRRALQKLGAELGGMLRELVPAENTAVFTVESKHVEYGCFDTHVSMTKTRRAIIA